MYSHFTHSFEFELYLSVISLLIGYHLLTKLSNKQSLVMVLVHSLKVLFYTFYCYFIPPHRRFGYFETTKYSHYRPVQYAWELPHNKQDLNTFFVILGRILLGPTVILVTIYYMTNNLMPALFWLTYLAVANIIKPQKMSRTMAILWHISSIVLGLIYALFFNFPLTPLSMLAEGLSPLFSSLAMGIAIVPVAMLMMEDGTPDSDPGDPTPPSPPSSPPATPQGEQPTPHGGQGEPSTPLNSTALLSRDDIVLRYARMLALPEFSQLQPSILRPEGLEPNPVLPTPQYLNAIASAILTQLRSGYVMPSSGWATHPAAVFGQDLFQLLFDFNRFQDEAHPPVPRLHILDGRTGEFVPLNIFTPESTRAIQFIMNGIASYMALASLDNGQPAFTLPFIDYVVRNGTLALNGIPFEQLQVYDEDLINMLNAERQYATPLTQEALDAHQEMLTTHHQTVVISTRTVQENLSIMQTPVVATPLSSDEVISEQDIKLRRANASFELTQRHNALMSLRQYCQQIGDYQTARLMQTRLNEMTLLFSTILESFDDRLSSTNRVNENPFGNGGLQSHLPINVGSSSSAGPSSLVRTIGDTGLDDQDPEPKRTKVEDSPVNPSHEESYNDALHAALHESYRENLKRILQEDDVNNVDNQQKEQDEQETSEEQNQAAPVDKGKQVTRYRSPSPKK